MAQSTLQGQTGMKLIRTQPTTTGIIAVDNGGRYIKVAKKNFVLQKPIPSDKVFGWDRNVGEDLAADQDYVIEWKGKSYFVGNIAQRETNALKLDGFTNSKSTDFFVLSTLMAIHQHGYDENYVVTCVPIKYHRQGEKDLIKKLLIDKHTLTVNGVTKSFVITDAVVMAECINAFWVFEPTGKSRWLDIGSRTVNFGTMHILDDEVFPIDGESNTFDLGLERTGVTDFEGFAKALAGQLGQKGWQEEDKIYIIGGGALKSDLVKAIQQVYPNAIVPTYDVILEENPESSITLPKFEGKDAAEREEAKKKYLKLIPQNLQVMGMYLYGEYFFQEIMNPSENA